MIASAKSRLSWSAEEEEIEELVKRDDEYFIEIYHLRRLRNKQISMSCERCPRLEYKRQELTRKITHPNGDQRVTIAIDRKVEKWQPLPVEERTWTTVPPCHVEMLLTRQKMDSSRGPSFSLVKIDGTRPFYTYSQKCEVTKRISLF
jgi:hypothetical protein